MDSLADERALVTGGAGVIGMELLELLGSRGMAVLSVDRLPLPRPVPDGVRHLAADLANADLAPIADFDPTLIFHLAATFERSVESPDFWDPNWSDNVVVSHRLAELAGRVASVRAFVFASSYLVYDPKLYLAPGPHTAVALEEGAALRPRNLCGAAKLYAEEEIFFMRTVARAAFRVVNARIFRVYGRGSRDVISRWVRAALDGEALEVFQPDNRFDYVYAGDVAEGLARIAASPAAEGIVNLATGRDRAIADVVEALRNALGADRVRTREVATEAPYEASRASVERLRELTGWTPPTDLAEGIARLVRHESLVHAGR